MPVVGHWAVWSVQQFPAEADFPHGAACGMSHVSDGAGSFAMTDGRGIVVVKVLLARASGLYSLVPSFLVLPSGEPFSEHDSSARRMASFATKEGFG